MYDADFIATINKYDREVRSSANSSWVDDEYIFFVVLEGKILRHYPNCNLASFFAQKIMGDANLVCNDVFTPVDNECDTWKNEIGVTISIQAIYKSSFKLN